jgi:hypothetical protein
VILGDAAALILKICMNKITKIYSRQGAASKMFIDTSAISSFSPVDKNRQIHFSGFKFLLKIHFYAFLQLYQQFSRPWEVYAAQSDK